METTEYLKTKSVLGDEVAVARPAAERLLFRSTCDYLGYLNEAHCTVDDVFDEHADGELPHDRALEAYEAFQSIAAIALAQMTLLRLRHPLLTVDVSALSN